MKVFAEKTTELGFGADWVISYHQGRVCHVGFSVSFLHPVECFYIKFLFFSDLSN